MKDCIDRHFSKYSFEKNVRNINKWNKQHVGVSCAATVLFGGANPNKGQAIIEKAGV